MIKPFEIILGLCNDFIQNEWNQIGQSDQQGRNYVQFNVLPLVINMNLMSKSLRIFRLKEILAMKSIFIFTLFAALVISVDAQNTDQSLFRQLGTELPDPNTYRTASGAPGHEYWQQRVDYDMKIRIDDSTQKLYGEETITYFNQSPDALSYLWLQLDQNVRAKDSDTYNISQSSFEEKTSFKDLMNLEPWFDGGFKIEYVKDAAGKDLHYVINKTMMRVDLPQSLKASGTFVFKIKWWYNINDRAKIGGRAGYEYFAEDDNFLYTIAQFYPRLAVYGDNVGWQHKQFLGSGEFALEFGNYQVAITVPADHVVGATGELLNAKDILTASQRKKLDDSRNAQNPVIVVSQDEAVEAEKAKSKAQKTWIFKAENVRDFAFANSRKFIWDAMGVNVGGKNVLCMSYYPKEGNPLWEQYSTKAVAHTIKTYSKYTVDYNYPVAISVHTDRMGMEYPMICFNGGRPEKDGTYSERTKYGMISVIIHEVGHNFFPMIINSDERQWTWMDEGLNTFVQYLTEKEWDRNYPTRRGPARNIVDYMGGDKSKIEPIMTNSESIWQFGNNAYGKPATALNILRETVMGRELFDFAFKEYCNRWAFRHPSPADFFRSMEDASAVDLDWFWRGWFFTTDHVDIALEQVKWVQLDTRNPKNEAILRSKSDEQKAMDISLARDRTDVPQTYIEKDPSLHDYYTQRNSYASTTLDEKEYQEYLSKLSDEEKKVLDESRNFYEITFKNEGGLVMPLILRFEFADGTEEIKKIPAEIWLKSTETVTKIFPTEKEVLRITLDPYLETADTDLTDNSWPAAPVPTRFQLFKESIEVIQEENPMQRAIRNEQLEGGKK